MRSSSCIYLMIILSGFTISLAEDTCCWSDAVVLPVPMPPGQTSYDYGGMLMAGINSPMLVPTDCPIPLDFYSYQGSMNLDDMVNAIAKAAGAEDDTELIQLRAQMHNVVTDYVFKSTLTMLSGTSIDGKLSGQFMLNVKMIDNCPGRQNNVLKEGQTSWDSGEWGIISPGVPELLEELGQSFMPVDKLILDYEGRPEQCQIDVEKNRVKPGETITITLSNILDGKGRSPKPWQPLIVEVDKGKILNGKKRDDQISTFLCSSGQIEVQFKAPDGCTDDKKINIKVSNSCASCPARFLEDYLPERELASKDILMSCQYSLTANHNVTINYDSYQETKQTSGGFTFYIEDDNTINSSQPEALTETSSGTVDDCVIETEGKADVVVTGMLIPNDGSPYLDITIEETWYLTMDMVCPDGSFNQQLPTQTVTHENLIFPLEDNYVLSQPFEGQGGSGSYTWTLDIP